MEGMVLAKVYSVRQHDLCKKTSHSSSGWNINWGTGSGWVRAEAAERDGNQAIHGRPFCYLRNESHLESMGGHCEVWKKKAIGSDLSFKFPLWTRHKAWDEETDYEAVSSKKMWEVRCVTCTKAVRTVMEARNRFTPYLGGQIMIGGWLELRNRKHTSARAWIGNEGHAHSFWSFISKGVR